MDEVTEPSSDGTDGDGRTAAAATRQPPSASRARRVSAAALLVVGTLVALLAILSLWIARQALDTDQWTSTSSKLLENPAVQTAVAGYLVDQLYAHVDVQGEIAAALPPRAAPLAGPAAGALRQGAEQVARRALETPVVQSAWEQANRRAHRRLLQVLRGGGDTIATRDGVVTLDLSSLLDQVADRTGIGARAAAALPAGAGTITLLRARQLSTAQSVANALKPLAALLTLLALACYAGAIWLARGRRRQMLRNAGFGLIVAGVAALIVRRLAGDEVLVQLAPTAAVRPAANATWEIGTSLLWNVATASILYGAVVVFAAWLAGPMRLASGLREAMAPYLRDWRIAYGATALVLLLVFLWGPTEGTRRPLPALLLLLLVLAGVETLRRQTRREFPLAERSAAARLESARAALGRLGHRAAARAGSTLGGDGGGANVAAAAAAPPASSAAPAAAAAEPIARLERLSALHRSGDLDDEEFTAAKRRVLAEI